MAEVELHRSDCAAIPCSTGRSMLFTFATQGPT